MSDSRATPGAAPPAPRPPSAAAGRAVSAARPAPLPEPPAGPLQARLRSATTNLGLNVLALGREALADWRRQDRFFRYKAAIVGGWLALSAMSLVVACPGASLRAADLGARLVVNTEQTPVIVLVHNESDEAWREVTVIVNQHWRASVEEVKAHGALALTPKLLMGANGTLAPADLRVTGVELRTREGRAQLDVEGR